MNNIELKDLSRAWLSPSGVLTVNDEHFHDRTAWHVELARCILRIIWKLNDTLDVYEKLDDMNEKIHYNATDYLEQKLSYVRLHEMGSVPFWIVNCKLTREQTNVIVDWCIANNRIFEDATNKHW